MVEILPIKSLRDEDAPIFGSLNILLAKLGRLNIPVGHGFVITPPNFIFKTVLEHFDFGKKEVFEQSLTLVKNEIEKIPVPHVLLSETRAGNQFFINGEVTKSPKELWLKLLNIWLEEIKQRIWVTGFIDGLTENLEPQVVIFTKKLESFGLGFFDPFKEDSTIDIKSGKLNPQVLKKIDELILSANKKLLIPHQYEWILDGGVKLVKISPFTPNIQANISELPSTSPQSLNQQTKSVVKVFLDLSNEPVTEENIDGIYISTEKIFDLKNPKESFEDLLWKVVQFSEALPEKPVLFKLADKSEGMGKIRGTLRLLHQKSLFDPMMLALDFIKYKKDLKNVAIVIPFLRSPKELTDIKKQLEEKKLSRKNSLQHFMEIAVPENIINLEKYLEVGLDGVVLNLDELIAHLNGFDHTEQELSFYKNEVTGLLKFLEEGLKILHKSRVPFIATGSLNLQPEVLEFLVERGAFGVAVEKYEAHSTRNLLYKAERKIILNRS